MRYKVPYSKISRQILLDKKFISMQDDAKLLFFCLLTHTSLTNLGGFSATREGLASERGWKRAKFSKAFDELIANDMVRYDEQAHCLILPNYLKHNVPESPNVVRSWEASLGLIPECKIKDDLITYVCEYADGLTEGFRKALPQVFYKGFGIQRQKQIQKQKQIQIAKVIDSYKDFTKFVLKNKYLNNRFSIDPEDLNRSVIIWEQKYPKKTLYEQFEGYLDYAKNNANGLKWKTFILSFTNWLKPKAWQPKQQSIESSIYPDDGPRIDRSKRAGE